MNTRANTRANWPALLGIFAILLQVVLFGCHHHELALPSQGGQPAVHAQGAAPDAPAGAEDRCGICQILHHQSTAPGGIAALAVPITSNSLVRPPGLMLSRGVTNPGFQARAPPQA